MGASRTSLKLLVIWGWELSKVSPGLVKLRGDGSSHWGVTQSWLTGFRAGGVVM